MVDGTKVKQQQQPHHTAGPHWPYLFGVRFTLPRIRCIAVNRPSPTNAFFMPKTSESQNLTPLPSASNSSATNFLLHSKCPSSVQNDVWPGLDRQWCWSDNDTAFQFVDAIRATRGDSFSAFVHSLALIPCCYSQINQLSPVSCRAGSDSSARKD